MKVLLVYAHPEPRSLNGALRDFAVAHLQAAGHEVQVSDLYAMGWKATLDAADAPHLAPGEPFDAIADSQRAYARGEQPADITAEQAKLLWADALILQFPLWWFSLPAILKGWVERVYACGFAYGVGEHSDHHWDDRYGEGTLAGKRALLVVTCGGWESHYSDRGINGGLDDILFPSSTASSSIPASACCRRSRSIAPARWTRPPSSGCARPMGHGWMGWPRTRPWRSGGRMARTTRYRR